MSSDYAEGFRAGAMAMRRLASEETDALAVLLIDIQAAHTGKEADTLTYAEIHEMMLRNYTSLTERVYSLPVPKPPLRLAVEPPA